MNLLFLLILTIFNRCESICLNSYHSCGKGDSFECVPKAWVCDNNRDCYDGSDELNCPQLKCEANEFKCVESDECISNLRLCDGISDCLDNSDENRCRNLRLKCNDITEYDCENKLKLECIPIEEVCNNRINCSTKKDSKENCKIDLCRDHGITKCSHSCINKYSSYICSCPLGMILGKDQKTCKHFNICLEKPDICSQLCEESSRGHKCSCFEGYLQQESRCELNNPNAAIYLLFSSLNYIYTVPILNEESKQSALCQNITISPNNVISFDVRLYEENMEIYSSLAGTPNGISINQFLDWQSVFNNPFLNNNKINIIEKKLNNISFYSTALDSTRNLLFYTDLSSRSISVMNISSLDKIKIIETDCFYPINIVIDPISLKIYWIDLGEENIGPRIQMANMDGSSRRIILSNTLHKPTSLAIDIEDQRLYWADHFPPTIQFLDLKSVKNEIVNTTVVLENYLFQPFSLYIFGNRIYWSDWQQNRIYSVHKTSGKSVVMIHRSNRPMNIKIISKVLNNQLIEKVNKLQTSKSCSGKINMCPYSCLPRFNSPIPKCFGLLSNHESKNSSKKPDNSRLWFVLIPVMLLTLISIVLFKYRFSKTRILQQNSNGNVYIYDNVKFWEEDQNSIQNENQAVNVSDALPIINSTY